MPLEIAPERSYRELNLRHLGGGLYEGTAPDKPHESQLRVLDNLDYGEDYPSLRTRPGLRVAGVFTTYNTETDQWRPVSGTITSLHRHQRRDGSTFYLASNGSTVGLWTVGSSEFREHYRFEPGQVYDRVRFVTFAGVCVVNPGASPPVKFDGQNFSLLGGNPPWGLYMTHHHNRLYLWGIQGEPDQTSVPPARLHISGLGNPEAWATTPAQDAHYIDVEPDDDAGRPTGIAVSPRIPRILLFKERAIYELFGTDPDTWEISLVTANVGCIAPDSIVQAKDVVLFLDQYGQVRAYQGGGAEPEVVSHPAVERTLAGLSRSQVSLAHAIMTQDDKYVLWFPTGTGYPTKAVVFDFRRGTWYTWTFPVPIATATVLDIPGAVNKPTLCFGSRVNNDACVLAMDSTTDLGTPVNWVAETTAFDFGPHRVTVRRVGVEGDGTFQLSVLLGERGSVSRLVTLSPSNTWAIERVPQPTWSHAFRLRVAGSGPVRLDQLWADLILGRGV